MYAFRSVRLIFYLSLLSLANLGAQSGSEEPANSPGLYRFQLKGSLIAPPLRVTVNKFLAATDDRRLNLIDQKLGLLWSLELPRRIEGPLRRANRFSVLLPLSGGGLACVSVGGKLLWIKRGPGEQDAQWFGTAEGRVVAISRRSLELFHPAGTSLLVFDLEGYSGAKVGQSGNVLTIPLDRGYYVFDAGKGELARQERPPTGMDGRPDTDSNQNPARQNLNFSSSNGESTYRVEISSPAVKFTFEGKGRLGHWLLDNDRSPRAAWGDSQWRFYLLDIDEARNPNLSAADSRQAALPEAGKEGDRDIYPSPPGRGLFYGLSAKNSLQLYYLKLLRQDSGGIGAVLDFLESSLFASRSRLRNNIDFYEDLLFDLMLEENSKKNASFPQNRQRILALLAGFPSFKYLDAWIGFFLSEKDAGVLSSYVTYFTALGLDPEGRIVAAIRQVLPSWLQKYGGSDENLLYALLNCLTLLSPSWPEGGEGAILSLLEEFLDKS